MPHRATQPLRYASQSDTTLGLRDLTLNYQTPNTKRKPVNIDHHKSFADPINPVLEPLFEHLRLASYDIANLNDHSLVKKTATTGSQVRLTTGRIRAKT